MTDVLQHQGPGDIRHTAPSNTSIREDIRVYWSKRAETFDQSWGHKIRSSQELSAWVGLFASPGGIKRGDRVLELASGTGEITRVLGNMGCVVDAIDMCEAMTARATAKPENAAVRFHLGDAENTMMPDAIYDAVICRHLVWTLVDPEAALKDWLRVLKPGGRLVIVDGDWVRTPLKARALKRLSAWIDRLQGKAVMWDQAAHEHILAQVHFRDGLTDKALSHLASHTGFSDIVTVPLHPIRRHQWNCATLSERLRVLATYDGHTFLLAARKPQTTD